jgi:CheY-like chemotaxis protein
MGPAVHILFVEWDGATSDALRLALEAEGFQVDCAVGGPEALRRLRSGARPDLALVDLTPAARGAGQFLAELRRDPAGTAVPVVVFCPREGTTFVEADAFLQKPIDYDDLLATIRRFCRDGCGAGPPEPSDQGRRVLIVEDNADVADSLRILLELLGHEVRVAYTGPEGVRTAHEFRPEVVLCDIGLPGLDGFGVAGELRHDDVTARTRLIAVTAYGDDATRQRALASGFDLLVTKPADPAALLQLVAQSAPGQRSA